MVFQGHGHMQYIKQDLQAEQRSANSANCQMGVKNYICQLHYENSSKTCFEAIQTVIEFKSSSEGRDRQWEIKLFNFNVFKTNTFNSECI